MQSHAVTETEHPLATTVRSVQATLQAAGASSRVNFVANTRLVAGYRTRAAIRDFSLDIDEPTSFGGTDVGPNPVEVVLAALGTCQEIVYATYAALLGIEIEHLSITVTGTLDPRGFYNVADVPAGFSDVQYEVDLRTSSPAEQVQQLVDLVQNHCPVLDILQRPIPVHGVVAVNGAALSSTTPTS